MNPKRLWPAAVVAVLAITVLANVGLLIAAHDRDAAVVEPDYYRKAVAFDSTLAARVASDSLGWHAEVALGMPGADGRARLDLRLTDRDGAPVAGAAVRVTATHNRDAARHVTGALAASHPDGGDYAGELAMSRAGRWQLDLHAERGSQRFSTSLRCESGGKAAR